MEARCAWFKAPGVVVLENCILGKAVYGLPEDYRYDCVVIDHKGKRMWAYPTGDKTKYFYWFVPTRLPVNPTIIRELVGVTLSANMGLDVQDIIPILTDHFGRLRFDELTVVVDYVTVIRSAILNKLENYLPATKIQRTWKRCISDPRYYMCERRLLREYNDMCC